MASFGGPSAAATAAASSPISPSHNPPPRTEHHTSDSDTDNTTKVNLTPITKTDLSIITPTAGEATTTPAGGSSSSAKKPRGRPRGSKNKPKPPMVIMQKDESAMHVAVLELKSGTNVIDAVSEFAMRRRVGISVISGSGSVINVVLRHPHVSAMVSSNSTNATYSLHGRFDIVSLSATILPSSSSSSSSSPFSVTVAGPQGAVYGGTVVGGLTAAGPVVIVAATFSNSEYQRLEGAVPDENNDSEGGGEEVKPTSISTSPVVGTSYGGGGGSGSGGANADVSSHSDHVTFSWGATSANRPPLHLHHHHHRHY